MIKEIEIKNNIIQFQHLSKGATFTRRGNALNQYTSVYLKTNEVKSLLGKEMQPLNAVSLRDGIVIYFSPEEEVIPRNFNLVEV